jgi:Holliday junction resolvasome RuvABC endonuclease subunit
MTAPWSLRDPAGIAVVGLDLSLESTGVAFASGECRTVDTKDLRGTERLCEVRQAVRDALDVCDRAPDLVLVEGYSFASKGRALFQLGELGGIVRMILADEAVMSPELAWGVVPPNAIKKYATGKGTANKIGMVVAARERLSYGGLSDDEADALWLRAMGLDLLGSPVVTMPKVNRSALAAVEIVHRSEQDAV